MAKKGKTKERVVFYYRGPVSKPHKVANEDELAIIRDSLRECLTIAEQVCFEINVDGQVHVLKLVAGLSASLRCLKQKRTRAIIYDDKAATHLTKYLHELANQQGIPIVQAHQLNQNLKSKFKSLMIVSIVDELPRLFEQCKQEGSDTVETKVRTSLTESAEFNRLYNFLEHVRKSSFKDSEQSIKLRPFLVESIPVTNKSKAKKEARKNAKKQKNTEQKLENQNKRT